MSSTICAAPAATSVPCLNPPKILSLSLVYPSPAEPGLGLFVRSRLQEIASSTDLKVVAPAPLVDYSSPIGKLFGHLRGPRRRRDGRVEVYHPRWFYPPGGTPWNILCLFLRLWCLLRRVRRTFSFELIDAHFGYPEGVVAALLAKVFGVPFMITLRGSEMMFARQRPRRLGMTWAFQQASHIVTVSSELRNVAISMGAPASRVTVIPNGIDSGLFHSRDRKWVRSKLGLSDSDRVILTAGELIEAKGHHLIIRALKTLSTANPRARLLIAGGIARGGSNFERQLRTLVSELGLADRVDFLGWIKPPALAEYMSAADVFCLASMTEGWPNVVHEAMSCGAPVVATRVGAVPEMIPSERYGIVIPSNDVNALTGALAQALERPWDREEIAALGQSRSWPCVAKEVGQVMRQIIRR